MRPIVVTVVTLLVLSACASNPRPGYSRADIEAASASRLR